MEEIIELITSYRTRKVSKILDIHTMKQHCLATKNNNVLTIFFIKR